MKRKEQAAPVSRQTELAGAILATCLRLNALGLNQGASGNISVRVDPGHFVITPSGMPYDSMGPHDLPVMDFQGRWFGPCRPSTEWRFHRDILKSRPEVNVVLHTHSMFSTVIACQREGIPAFHYMIGVSGGDSIRCAPYATFGTQALSDHALKALEGRRACLLANHGLICLGANLEAALGLAVEVETLAAMFVRVRQMGAPKLLHKAEMARVIELFGAYGTPEFPDAELVRAGEAWGGA